MGRPAHPESTSRTALAKLGRLEDAAVEQHRRGHDRRPARVERAGLLAEEPGQVAGDGRVRGIREADLGQADPSPARRQVGRGASRQETLEHRVPEHLTCQLRLDRTRR